MMASSQVLSSMASNRMTLCLILLLAGGFALYLMNQLGSAVERAT